MKYTQEQQEETLEEAKNNAWQNYEYGQGHLYSRTFFDAFELGYNLAKEQETLYCSKIIKEQHNFIIKDVSPSNKLDIGGTIKILQQEQDKNKFSEEEVKNLFNHPVMDRIRSSKSDAEARRIILQQIKKK